MSTSSNMPEKNCILIVDDDFINRAVLQNIFSEKYVFEEAENGHQALEKVDVCLGRLCAILLDVNMPEMDGIELLRVLKQRGITESVPTFLITANDELDVSKQAYELGVMDVINKPVVSFIIKRRVQSVIELFRARETLSETVVGQQKQLRENADTIDELHRGTIEVLASAIEFRDTESGEHTNRIYSITKCILSYTEMGEGFTPEEIENIAIGSIMHDVGKIAISDVILNKPGKLTQEEYEIMKRHTVKGAELMRQLSQLQAHPSYAYACDIALHHHERWDGRGYPDGLKGDEITVWSQVVSIADVYDALISPRVYKKAFDPDRAVEMIVGGECGAFNPKLIACFEQVEPLLRKLYNPDEQDELAQLKADTLIKSQHYFTPKGEEGQSKSEQEVVDTLMLMSAIISSFDMIICANLTKNSYYMMSYEHFRTHCAGNDGEFDELIIQGAMTVPEPSRQQFIDCFSRENLLKGYAKGKNMVSLNHPQVADDGAVHMVNTTVVLLEETRSGDVIDITFSRYIDHEWKEHYRKLDEVAALVRRVEAEKGVDLGEIRQALSYIIEMNQVN